MSQPEVGTRPGARQRRSQRRGSGRVRRRRAHGGRSVGRRRPARSGPHRPAHHSRGRGPAAALRRRLRRRSGRGTVAGGRASATPPPPATACARGPRRRARCSPAASSDAAHRPVRLRCPAVVGSVSAWLPAQVETVLEARRVDLAVIFIGANDVTTGSTRPAGDRHLGRGGRPRCARAGRRGGRGHLPRSRHDPADPAAAALAGPALEPAAGGGADGRGRSGPAAARCPWATCSGRASTPPRTRMFGADRFHPSAAGLRGRGRRRAARPRLAALGLAAPDARPLGRSRAGADARPRRVSLTGRGGRRRPSARHRGDRGRRAGSAAPPASGSMPACAGHATHARRVCPYPP